MLGKHFNSDIINKGFAKNCIPPRYGRVAAFWAFAKF